MTLIESLYAQGLRALREPRAAGADIIALGVPKEALVPGLFAVVAISVILNSVGEAIAPSPFVMITPFQMTILLSVMMVAFSFAIAKTGKFMGGLGEFPDALLLMIFLQAMFLPAVALQLVLALAMPTLAGLLMLVVMIYLTWVHVNFIAALHGFTSLGRAFGVLLMSVVITFFILMFVAPLLVTPIGVLSDV
jgi:hypothetical protein